MPYQITIVKTEPNPNLEKDKERYESERRMGMYNRGDMVAPPQEEVRKNVLMVELSEAEYKAVKTGVLKVFE